MNNEIKEILRNCEKAINEASGHNDTTDKILDYITNLQTIEQQYSALLSENAELENKITNLQQENERLKEENKRIFSKVNDDELLISNAMNYAELQDYKSRCEKTIPMLKELNIKIKEILRIGIDIKEISDIENILNGGDKDAKN